MRGVQPERRSAATPGRAHPSLVNRPNAEATPSMMAPKYQKNAPAVKNSGCSSEEQRGHDDGCEPEAVVGKGAQGVVGDEA